MDDEKLVLKNEFEKKFIEESFILNFNTVLKLLVPESIDAFILYCFYAKTAKLQNNTSVYATNNFCIKGLGWGQKRFYAAKKILTDLKLIEIVKRIDDNKIVGHYIKIKYLKDYNNHTSPFACYGPSHIMTPVIVWPESYYDNGTSQNTIYKKRNTINKKENTINEKEKIKDIHFSEIFDHWNNQKIIIHKKLNPRMKSNITKALKYVSTSDLKNSISNYSEILKNDEYYFTWKWTLTDFLARGLSESGLLESKGFWMFLPSDDPSENPFVKFSKNKNKIIDLFTERRNKFSPITVLYDRSNLLDKDKNTYFGFDTETLKNPTNRLDDLEWTLEHNKNFDFYTFCDLELIISHLFFTRKVNPRLEELDKCLELWENNKDKFKKDARRLLRERYT